MGWPGSSRAPPDLAADRALAGGEPSAGRRRGAGRRDAVRAPTADRPDAPAGARPLAPAAGPAAALLIGLAVLVTALGVEVRRGNAEQAALRATLATTTVGAAAREAGLSDALAEAALSGGRQRED